MALHGPGAAETQKHYERSYTLCQTLPEEPSHFPLYWGWWRVAEDFHAMESRSTWLLSRGRGARRCRIPDAGASLQLGQPLPCRPGSTDAASISRPG